MVFLNTSMKTILVLGKGYISSKIEKYWSLDKDEYRLVRVSRSEVDYTVPDRLKGLLDKEKPEYVVNAYGYTGKPNVDACEDNEDECFKRNVRDQYCIWTECDYLKIPIIFISTGCLYNDETGRVFTETDPHNFGGNNPTVSVYSKTKSFFEDKFFKHNCEFLDTETYLLRIRMPFDDEMDDKNYINKIIKYDKLINYPNSVTYIPDLVGFIETIITKEVPRGIYNVVNKNPIKAERVIEIYNDIMWEDKQVDKWYSVDDLLSMGLMKCRRSNCVLSTEKIEKYYPELLTSEDAVKDALSERRV